MEFTSTNVVTLAIEECEHRIKAINTYVIYMYPWSIDDIQPYNIIIQDEDA